MEEEEPTSSRREWKRPTLEELLLNIETEKSRKTPERRTVTYEHIGGVGHKSQKSDSMRDCEKQPKYRIPKKKSFANTTPYAYVSYMVTTRDER